MLLLHRSCICPYRQTARKIADTQHHKHHQQHRTPDAQSTQNIATASDQHSASLPQLHLSDTSESPSPPPFRQTLSKTSNKQPRQTLSKTSSKLATTSIRQPPELGLGCITHRVISDRVHRLLVTLSYFRPDRFVQLLSLIPILILLLYYLVSGCLTSLC